ncbi:hypothetical protein BpHYR1_000865 [Brachionus plicatilis]|uniref:Uncharacterized protein n=1 Tax=Brachionus plicatilis TaxID=10195 RepID=A0A3M7S354_BRAPC|nr:hypothetical protein BpHYR1_000865 [Brachionus plicatilis]
MNNGIGNIIAQVAGPFSSQFGVYQASKEVQYSQLNENNQNQSENSWNNFLSKIAFIIDKAMKFIKSVKIVYDIICTGRDIANLTNEKISKKINNINNSAKRNSNESQTRVENASTEQTSEAYESQHTVLIETRSVNDALKLIKDKEEELEEETEMENESETKPELNPEESQEIEKYIEKVNQSILDTISKKIEENIVKPAFTSLISFSLGALYKKLDDRFGQDLENIKKISVVYGEYQTRNKNNSQEIDIEMESGRDFLINEPSSLPIDTPIYETNLEEVKCGQVNVMIKGEIKVLDLSNEEDRQFIRDQISAQGIRFITTQKGITLSIPNFLNYINSITPEKRFTEYELDILAQQFNVKIVVITSNQQVKIGSNEGQNEGEIYISLKNGHYEPMIKCDDKYVLISDLESPDKKCGPHAFFYAMKMNDLMKKNNMSFDDADKQTRDNIDIEVDKMLQNMQEYAKNSESAWQLFVGREHEGTFILSGKKRNENSLPPGQVFFAGTYIKKYQIEKNIKQDIKDLVKIFEKYIDKAMQPETRENRKKKANDYIEENWNKTNDDNSKRQMIIEFVIVKPKDDKQNKIIFAFGKTPLYNKQLTDDNMKITELLTNQTGEQKAIIDIRETSNFKTKNGFEFINVGIKYNDSGVRACVTAKALEYLKETIGLSNVKSFELGEIIYEHDNTGPRTQPNINGIEFATSFEGFDNIPKLYGNDRGKKGEWMYKIETVARTQRIILSTDDSFEIYLDDDDDENDDESMEEITTNVLEARTQHNDETGSSDRHDFAVTVSDNEENIDPTVVAKKRGRPAGSKNKPKDQSTGSNTHKRPKRK